MKNTSKKIKVIINTCFGGFGLSEAAIKKLAELGSKPALESIKRYEESSNKPYGGLAWCTPNIERTDPLLIKVVEEMKKDSWGPFAKLKVIKIPSDVKWEIDEYDGNETVVEKSRRWG